MFYRKVIVTTIIHNTATKSAWSCRWIILENVLSCHCNVRAYKIMHKFSPHGFLQKCTSMSSAWSYNTRTNQNLQIPKDMIVGYRKAVITHLFRTWIIRLLIYVKCQQYIPLYLKGIWRATITFTQPPGITAPR